MFPLAGCSEAIRFLHAASLDILRPYLDISTTMAGGNQVLLPTRRSLILRSAVLLLCAISSSAQQTPPPVAKPLFTLQEVMIPVRDGVRLQTAILTPLDPHG